MNTFTRSSVATNNISVLADEPVLTPANLKLAFDQYGIDDKTYTNDTLILELESSSAGDSGAGKIGSESIPGLVGTKIRDQVLNLYAQLQEAVLSGIADFTITDDKIAVNAWNETFTYTNGVLSQVLYKSGLTTKQTDTFTYDSEGRLSTYTHAVVGGKTFVETYSYNADGTINTNTKVVS